MRLNRPEDVGALVSDYRRTNGIRQADLAKRLHVSPKWLSHFENGKATVQIGLVIRVLQDLGFALTAERIEQRKPPSRRSRPRFSINDVVDG